MKMIRMLLDDIMILCEELRMNKTVSLGNCPRSTAYNITKRANTYLASSGCNWRVKVAKGIDGTFALNVVRM